MVALSIYPHHRENVAVLLVMPLLVWITGRNLKRTVKVCGLEETGSSSSKRKEEGAAAKAIRIWVIHPPSLGIGRTAVERHQRNRGH
jgi:hypothetical protein